MKKLFVFIALIIVFDLSAQSVSRNNIESIGAHPRLILRDGDIARLRSLVEDNPEIGRLYESMIKVADRTLEEPVCERQKKGKRLLGVSRKVLERVLCCACSYLVTNDRCYAERAEKEMVAAAKFEDWNPSHFLDVGEMMTALALGYDWLYDSLSEESRRIIEQAIINKGIYGAENDRQMWFYKRKNNWNQVCNGGFVLGALAVADKEPSMALEVLNKSIASNSFGLQPYAPDGVYPEGYSYWSYGTWYQVLIIEALRTALGDSCGLERAEGFMESAYFMNYVVAPSGRAFNFSDCGSHPTAQNLLLGWFACESGDMSLIYQDLQSLRNDKLRLLERRFLPVGLIFLSRCDLSNMQPLREKVWSGDGVQPIFVYRSGWRSKDDTYLAVKGGSPANSHAHMDGGSFVYEWGGVRWSCDLGSQDYYSLESRGVKLWRAGQESERWEVFRLNNLSHSTLSVNDEKHLYDGSVKMIEVYDTVGRYGAKFDLAPILKGVGRAERTITTNGIGVTVVDEVEAEERCLLRWVMCTPAKATIEGKGSILLESNGRKLRVELVAPHRKVKPFILSNDPPHDYDAPNKGTCRVGFVLDLGANRPTVLQIRLTPLV